MTAARRSHPTKVPGLYRVDPSRIYSNGAWEVRYRDARNRTRRKTFKIQQDALDFKAAIRMDPALGDYRRRASTRFEEVAENWYATTADLKPKTREGYRNTLDRYLLPAFGDSAIGAVEASDLRDFLGELPKALSPTTRRNIFRTLSPIFKQALTDRMLTVNPVTLVKQPKADTRKQYILKGEQVATLAEAIAPEYRTLIYFLAYTGVRAGEAAALQVKHLDLLRRRVRIERSVSEVALAYLDEDADSRLVFGSPKNGKAREFTIPAFLGDMLAAHLAGRPNNPEALVFPGPRGGPMRWANFRKRHFHPTVEEVLPENFTAMRVHDLRHTCASLLIAAGVNAKAIQEQLGHSSITVTFDVYGSLFPDQHERVANAMEEMYQAAAGGSAGATVTPIR